MKHNCPQYYILVGLLVTVAFPVCPQRVYTLDECRTMALENNVKVRNAANAVEAAEAERKQAFTGYFPTVGAAGMGYNANKGLLQFDMAPGMSMSMLKNGIAGGITVAQPLFAGGQIVNSNRLAAVGVEVNRVQREQSENEVRLTVERYYWQVVSLSEKLNTLGAVGVHLDRIVKDVQAAVDAGVTTRNDLLQVQLRQNDLESRRIGLAGNLSLCRMLLAQYVGLEEDSINVECPVDVDVVPEFPQDIYCDHRAALARTTGYRLLENNVKASRLQQKIVTGQNLPSVAIGAGYVYDNLMDKSHAFAVGYVSVSVPLSGWWGGSYAIRKRKLQVMDAENQLEDSAELLVIGMQQAWNDLQDAYRQILVARKSIDQSSENLRLNEAYYRAGTTSVSDLLDAQTLFRQSRDKYVDAYAQFRVKIVEYMQATGR